MLESHHLRVLVAALALLTSACSGPDQDNATAQPDMQQLADMSAPDEGADMRDAPDMRGEPDMRADTPDMRDGEDMRPAAPLVVDAGESRYALVGQPVTLDGSATTGAVEYQWSVGDGSEPERPSGDPTAEVTYTTPGRYRAVLTAWDANGTRRTDVTLISVTRAPVNPRIASSSVTYQAGDQPARGRVAIASEDASLVAIISRDQEDFTLDAHVAVTGSPRHVALDADWLAVTTRQPAGVELIDLSDTTNRQRVELPTGSRPHALLWLDDTIWITLQGTGELAKLDVAAPASPGEVERSPVIQDARGMALLPDGALLVTRWRSPDDAGELARVDRQTGEVQTWQLPFDPRPSSDTESGGVPSYLEQAAISPTTSQIAIPSMQVNFGQGLARDGKPLEHDTTVRAVLSLVDAASGQTDYEDRIQFDGRGLAYATIYSARGDYLYTTMRGSRVIEKIDVLDGGADAGTLFEVGWSPQGLAMSDDDRFLFADASLSRQLVVFDTTTIDRAPIAHARVELVETEPLDQTLLRGKQLFNDSFDRRLTPDGYIACAHCHLEGEADLRTWDFTQRGEGFRNTISLIGRAGSGHGPIHWSGNFDEIQDFEHDIREHQAGSGLLEDADYIPGSSLGAPKAGKSGDLDALAAYLTSLDAYLPSPHEPADMEGIAQVARGAALFESAELGCATCHTGDALTDSQFVAPGEPLLHDVGTMSVTSGQRLGGPLTGIDTPTLRGLWNSAPYLHDGSAATLLEVLVEKNPSDLHGVTSGLTPSERDDLIAYLLTL